MVYDKEGYKIGWGLGSKTPNSSKLESKKRQFHASVRCFKETNRGKWLFEVTSYITYRLLFNRGKYLIIEH